jgi:hypothetical protein
MGSPRVAVRGEDGTGIISVPAAFWPAIKLAVRKKKV